MIKLIGRLSYFSFSLCMLFNCSYSYADDNSGVIAAARLQRNIIKHCILNAEIDNQVDSIKLKEKYGNEAQVLYVLNLKIYEATALIKHHQQSREFSCEEWFPYLAWVHFYNGYNTIDGLKREIIKLRKL